MTTDHVPMCCGHEENHCRWCGVHYVVTVLREDHELVCVAAPVRGVA